MSLSVGLYRDFARQGRVTFRILPITQSSDCVSKPVGVLSHDQVEHVSRQLCRTPVVEQGAVGQYVWRREEA